MGNMSDDYLGVTDEVEKLGTNVSTVGKQVSDQVFKTDNIEGVGDEADNTSKDIKDLQEEIEGLKKKVGENYSTDNLTSLQEKYEATSNKVQTVWNKVNALHDKVKQTFTTSTIESLTGKYKGLTEAVKNAIAAVQSLSPDGNGSQGANGAAATGAITGSYKGKNGGLNTPEIVSNALKVEFLKSLLSEHYGESGLTVGFARHVLRTAMGFDEQPGKGTMTYTLMDTDVDGKDISVADSRIALRAAIGLDNEQLIEWANAVWDRGAKQGLYSGNSAVVKTGAWKIDALPQEDEDYLQTVAKTLAEKQAVINAATAIAAQLDTGGYTGEWDSSGRLAVLHQKEIVLNKYDTSNFLSGIEVLREISKAIDLQAISAQMAQSSAFTALRLPTSMVQPVQQDVHISASFPNVNDSREIEAALENLVNEAVQYTSQQF